MSKKIDVLTRMFEYRFDDNDERRRYRKRILFSSFKIKINVIKICFINVVNDLYDRILKINKKKLQRLSRNVENEKNYS